MSINLRTLGIEVQSSLFEATSWDYELLYLPYGSAGDICALTLEADKQRARLPHRIVIGEANNSEIDKETICAFTTKHIAARDKDSILEVYDEWISFLLRRRGLDKVSLSVFFENLPAVANNWKEVNSYKPSYVEEVDAFDGDASFDVNKKVKGINLWRHIKLSEFLPNVNRKQDVIYYQCCTYGDPFFAYLSGVNPGTSRFQAQYLLRQIVEMALCRTVIIDERIAQTVDAKKSNQPGKSLANVLAWMGIWIVGRVEFKNNGQSIKDAILVGAEPSPQNGLVTLIMDYNGEGFKTQVEYPNGLEGFPKKPCKIEILTVHQTILDGKFQEPLRGILGDDQWKENWILRLKPQVLFVYSHSGRGHPRELLPKNAPFLEYSFLQTHILSQQSKFFFVQLALASKEPRR